MSNVKATWKHLDSDMEASGRQLEHALGASCEQLGDHLEASGKKTVSDLVSRKQLESESEASQ